MSVQLQNLMGKFSTSSGVTGRLEVIDRQTHAQLREPYETIRHVTRQGACENSKTRSRQGNDSSQ